MGGASEWCVAAIEFIELTQSETLALGRDHVSTARLYSTRRQGGRPAGVRDACKKGGRARSSQPVQTMDLCEATTVSGDDTVGGNLVLANKRRNESLERRISSSHSRA